MLNLLLKGVQTKLFKFFCWKIFSICHRCRWHRWQTLSCEYLREFSEKFETALMVQSEAWGKLIQEKNQKQKISWHCPFKFLSGERTRFFYHTLFCKERALILSALKLFFWSSRFQGLRFQPSVTPRIQRETSETLNILQTCYSLSNNKPSTAKS